MTKILSLINGNPTVLLWIAFVAFIAGVAVGGSAAGYVQQIRIDRLKVDHDTYVARVERAVVEARQAVIDQKEKWRKEKDDAEKTAKQREDALQSDLATAAATADRLRNTVGALRANLVTAAQPAIVETASALADVFEQCQSDYREMAEAADRHASDVKTLMDAWPK